uniref:TLDc domain-containing protein n=2 Tax=Scylla olivacea TaxID=85551 RepID=A0A0P4WD62_SCYOL
MKAHVSYGADQQAADILLMTDPRACSRLTSVSYPSASHRAPGSLGSIRTTCSWRLFIIVKYHVTAWSRPSLLREPRDPSYPDQFPPTPLLAFRMGTRVAGGLHFSDKSLVGVSRLLEDLQHLGLEELCQHCEDHIATTMTPHNACTFLMAALKMEQRTGGSKGSRSFVDRCVAYIGENALECMQTSSFLNLSREALIRLISSDNLALEEEDVWRGVLNWAKYGAGVAQPTAHWTEEERLRVCQQLQGVINHVRLLLIDSQVFAEEVEPTGAVPMELSLERYRYAALPNKFKDNSTNEDKRLQPRVSLKLFAGSQILINEKMSLQRILNNWYGVNKQMWRLVYRASTHGYSADAFHRHCDGVAPTYTIVMGQHGEICGGFSDVPWGKTTMKGRYVASDKAFLFTLVNNQDIPPTKFPVIKKMFAICYHPDCGPIFGAGADLFIAGNCNQNLESYSNLPHSYDGENASCNTLMSDYNFTVLDYEVFSPYGK